MSQPWNCHFLNSVSLFAPLLPAYQNLPHNSSDWPGLSAFNQALQNSINPITSGSGALIHFVPQQKKTAVFTEQYEPKIFLTGAVQMREYNWHDFFNALVWLTFPKTKAILNKKQYLNLQQRVATSSQRTPLENALTLFDENGAFIISTNPQLSALIRNFQWKELFWQRRQEALTQMRFFIFGHSLYEKALQPYLGITASSIIFDISADFLAAPTTELDSLLENYFTHDSIQSPRELNPLPILGIPGWIHDNNQSEYYDNQQYFRSGRNSTSNS